jgi:hypothetical protein
MKLNYINKILKFFKSDKGEILLFVIIFGPVVYLISTGLGGILKTNCLDEDYKITKAKVIGFTSDGNANQMFTYKFEGEEGIIDGSAYFDTKYSVKIGDTLIVKYCREFDNVNRVLWEDERMNKPTSTSGFAE